MPKTTKAGGTNQHLEREGLSALVEPVQEQEVPEAPPEPETEPTEHPAPRKRAARAKPRSK